MTSLTIYLPDMLAERARQAGLLENDKLIQLIDSQLNQSNIHHTTTAQAIFQPFAATGHPVSNEHINQLRDLENI